MKKLLLSATLILASLGALPTAQASGPEPAEFSATMVQTLPQNKTITTRINVGKDVVRSEMSHDGQVRITIVDNARHVAWMLNPAKKEYVQMQGGAAGGQAGPHRPPLPDEPGSPCTQPDAKLTCKKLGTETIEGRPADKWEFISKHDDNTYRSLVWIDRELRVPLRQEFAGGVMSELKDIRVGPQPASLFRVPADYKKIEMPSHPHEGTSDAHAPGDMGSSP